MSKIKLAKETAKKVGDVVVKKFGSQNVAMRDAKKAFGDAIKKGLKKAKDKMYMYTEVGKDGKTIGKDVFKDTMTRKIEKFNKGGLVIKGKPKLAKKGWK